jgi:ribosome-associated protein
MSGPQADAIDIARIAAAAADAKSAEDVLVLDVSGIIGICDLFVIASARNVRQVSAIAEEIEERVYVGHDLKPASVEGLDARRWVLVDYGDVVVHLFLDEEREYYRLERLYGDAPQLEWTPDGDPRATRRSGTA